MNREPNDQSERQRFAREIEQNFSVVAAAGSGKTRSITDRIVEIARTRPAFLPQLVVVTFTNRAADEMQQRTRQRILASERSPEVLTLFNRAFFGTIHSFCMKLLTDHGHYLGLPTPLELIADDDELWQEFVQQQTRLGESLSDENRAALFRLAQARDIMELGRRAGSALLRPGQIGPCPQVDFSEVHAAVVKGTQRTRDYISNSKADLADWEERYNADWEFLRWPLCSSTAKEFSARWREAFAPLRQWVNQAALCIAADVQREYREFRLERGVVTYADQIALADELLQHPTAARRIREQNFRVILDEAQDTDPAQFSVLLEAARPVDATGRWIETLVAPARAGHFCMVGDFQQSIYGDRADLNNYRRVHETLIATDAAEALKFSVTFRLDQRQVDFVNETFRRILNDENGQIAFVELQPRPDVLPGQVIRVSLDAGLSPNGEKLKDRQKAKREAEALAKWIRNIGFQKLRASSWREVAILCPRKAWLRMMATELRRVDVPVAIQSESAFKGDSPAHAWLTALCTIMVDPLDGYEIAGVLREVFGISDHDLAVFSEGDGTRFRIDGGLAAAGVVSSQLRALADTREQVAGKPLFDAVTLLVCETKLRERLAALPTEEFGDLESELDALLAAAATAETAGDTLADFAEKLRADFEAPREGRLSSDEGLQLITSQKAKGSEWQAVILPFLGRDIRTPPPRYPSLIKQPGSGELLVALSKEDPSDEIKEARKQAERQEMERLLYVAATRARHTLVLAFDRELFLNSKGALSSTSQLKRLQGDSGEPNAIFFDKLTTNAEACALTSSAAAEAQRNGTGELSQFPPLNNKTVNRATKHARDFVRKFNPSGYDEEVVLALDQEIEASTITRRSTPDTPATLYGRWWHELFEQLKWSADAADLDPVFQRRVASSPDPRRSTAEWKLARETLLRDDSPLTQFASRSGAHAHAEFPFGWSIDQRACVEGVIDLLLIDVGARECLLVDWKTNRIANGREERLRKHYEPQIAAYWKAVGEITQLDVQAAIYSTATGKFLTYDAAELSRQWARLAALSADELRGQLVPDEI